MHLYAQSHPPLNRFFDWPCLVHQFNEQLVALPSAQALPPWHSIRFTLRVLTGITAVASVHLWYLLFNHCNDFELAMQQLVRASSPPEQSSETSSQSVLHRILFFLHRSSQLLGTLKEFLLTFNVSKADIISDIGEFIETFLLLTNGVAFICILDELNHVSIDKLTLPCLQNLLHDKHFGMNPIMDGLSCIDDMKQLRLLPDRQSKPNFSLIAFLCADVPQSFQLKLENLEHIGALRTAWLGANSDPNNWLCGLRRDSPLFNRTNCSRNSMLSQALNSSPIDAAPESLSQFDASQFADQIGSFGSLSSLTSPEPARFNAMVDDQQSPALTAPYVPLDRSTGSIESGTMSDDEINHSAITAATFAAGPIHSPRFSRPAEQQTLELPPPVVFDSDTASLIPLARTMPTLTDDVPINPSTPSQLPRDSDFKHFETPMQVTDTKISESSSQDREDIERVFGTQNTVQHHVPAETPHRVKPEFPAPPDTEFQSPPVLSPTPSAVKAETDLNYRETSASGLPVLSLPIPPTPKRADSLSDVTQHSTVVRDSMLEEPDDPHDVSHGQVTLKRKAESEVEEEIPQIKRLKPDADLHPLEMSLEQAIAIVMQSEAPTPSQSERIKSQLNILLSRV